MLPLCRAEGVGIIPWSPLARGFLAGNRERGAAADGKKGGATLRAQTDEYAQSLYYADSDFSVVDRVVEIARLPAGSPPRRSPWPGFSASRG